MAYHEPVSRCEQVSRNGFHVRVNVLVPFRAAVVAVFEIAQIDVDHAIEKLGGFCGVVGVGVKDHRHVQESCIDLRFLFEVGESTHGFQNSTDMRGGISLDPGHVAGSCD